MDEKRAMSPIRPSCPSRRTRLPITLALAGLCLYLFYHVHIYVHPLPTIADPDRWYGAPASEPTSPVQASRKLVPLEAHIMSKCPDARDCLRDMVLPAMMRVHDKVNFTLSFIGTPTENDGVSCKHGPAECLGNILELCAQRLYPDPKTYLGFVMCLTRNYKEIPQRTLIEDCALEHAIDFDELNDCAAEDDGALGMGMLRDSVRRTLA
ncbi:hypothetical protein QBC33DRAFT_288897 [Phialemonium atrogriseum]|uniref:Gamma interferon inducible lysosomal thiol reductase n=1 Tax=Phialemonium atrogriseum TaxID=1093897 RepID=A0AAJ0BQ82_9PEZI|nr:uncharacterized protein QBC33DRAFT_288897 [Phialemonium atrogriseum]KAK1762271.1 hypothetical protein QBC33DRAFT_288897 [Phialemonium atrogriseum]